MLPDNIEWVEVYMRIKYLPHVLFLVKIKDKDKYYLTDTTTFIFTDKPFTVRNFRKYNRAIKYLSGNYYEIIRGKIC